MSNSPSTATSPPVRGLLFAGLGAGVWVTVWWMIHGPAAPPFATWDIALVAVIGWVPAGIVLSESLRGMPRLLMGVPAAGFLVWSAFTAGSIPDIGPHFSRWFWGAALGISTAVLVRSFERRSEKKPVWPLSSLVLLVPLTAIVTGAFTLERSRYLEQKLAEYLSQYRLMEARELVSNLQVLDPQRTISQEPMFLLAERLDRELDTVRQEVEELQNRRAESPKSLSPELRIELAQNLAILGQMEEATAELTRLTKEDPQSFAAFNLLGTIREHREDWEQSLRSYERARDVLVQRAESPERRAGLIQALKGIAYTQRKRGQYREAESAYEEVLTLAPTAEHHFLLAQFYEDAQQGDKAQFHAYKAADLNPRFRENANQLVEGMLGEQFGCWSIFQNRRR